MIKILHKRDKYDREDKILVLWFSYWLLSYEYEENTLSERYEYPEQKEEANISFFKTFKPVETDLNRKYP